MTMFANIATLVFGTYDNDISKRWVGDKMSQRIIDNGTKDLKLKNSSIFGLGESLGLKEDVLKDIVKEKDNAKRLAALKAAAGATDDADFAKKLQANLDARYTDGYKNTSFLSRFKANFNQVKAQDPIYRIASGKSGAKTVWKELVEEVTKAGAGKTGVKKVLSQAAKVGGKSLPLIGAVTTLIFDVPKIIKSFNNHGAGEGIKQTGRTAVSLAGMAAGTAAGATIGSAVPVVGTIIGGIVGGMVGGFLGDTIFGKSKVDEAEAQKEQQEAMAQEAPQQAIQPSAFGTYSAPQAYQMPMFASRGGGISLGDENSMSNAMSTYRMSQMVA